LVVEVLVGVLGSYTVEGRRIGGSEGIFGGPVTEDGGSYAGERGRCRRGLDVGERGAELAMREGESGPLAAAEGSVVLGVVMLSLREKLGWCWWCAWSLLLAWVLWDQRFRLAEAAEASRCAAAAMPSAAPLAALERRRVCVGGGGVAWIFMLERTTVVEAGMRVSGQASG
jgi:hypothetical protein